MPVNPEGDDSFNVTPDDYDTERFNLHLPGIPFQHAQTGPDPIFGLALACADRIQPWTRMQGPAGLPAVA